MHLTKPNQNLILGKWNLGPGIFYSKTQYLCFKEHQRLWTLSSETQESLTAHHRHGTLDENPNCFPALQGTHHLVFPGSPQPWQTLPAAALNWKILPNDILAHYSCGFLWYVTSSKRPSMMELQNHCALTTVIRNILFTLLSSVCVSLSLPPSFPPPHHSYSFLIAYK